VKQLDKKVAFLACNALATLSVVHEYLTQLMYTTYRQFIIPIDYRNIINLLFISQTNEWAAAV